MKEVKLLMLLRQGTKCSFVMNQTESKKHHTSAPRHYISRDGRFVYSDLVLIDARINVTQTPEGRIHCRPVVLVCQKTTPQQLLCFNSELSFEQYTFLYKRKGPLSVSPSKDTEIHITHTGLHSSHASKRRTSHTNNKPNKLERSQKFHVTACGPARCHTDTATVPAFHLKLHMFPLLSCAHSRGPLMDFCWLPVSGGN